jgi:TetR/AcrR family transcriptional regulator
MLTFSERNPGITRVLLGEALMGEHERLRARAAQFFNRVETQLKQILREGEHRGEVAVPLSSSSIANLLIAVVEGRMSQYSRSGFQRQPTEGWAQQWKLLASSLFATRTPTDG